MLRYIPLAFTFVKGEDDYVKVGTKDTLSDFLKNAPDGALVEYYAPWCGHCKSLEPEYKKAAEALKDNEKVALIKVDATVESELAQKEGVQGYPTIKWCVGEGKCSDYDGPRQADGIVDWVKSMTGPAVVEGEPAEDDVFAVFSQEADGAAFEEVAKANRKKAKWYHKKGSGGVTVKHKGEDAIECGDVKTEECFKKNMFPLYGALNGETFATYMEGGKGMVWTLWDPETCADDVEKNRADMVKLAKSVGDYTVTHTDTKEFGKVLEGMFGITTFPRVVVQTKVGDKKNYIYDGEMTESAIGAFVKKVQNGEVEPNLKSEEIPEAAGEGEVTVVVGKNLQEVVFHKEKDVLLEVYAPWCGHCKKLEPEYNKVAKKVAKEGFENILTIAKLDGTLNDSPVDSLTWEGFPTLYYVKAGSSEPVKYDGGRDAKGIWKWIKANHSKKDEIKEKLAAKKASKDEEKKDDKKEDAKEEL